MKPLNILVSTVAAACVANAAFAQDSCPSGERRLRTGDPCMPSMLVDYLYCLQNSGSGQIEFKRTEGSENSSDVQISFGGNASGVILKGGANGEYSKSEVAKATKGIEAKLDPNLTSNCKEFANKISAACQPHTYVHSVSRTSDWMDTNWDLTQNPRLDLQVPYNERISSGQVQAESYRGGVIAVSPVSISPDGRSASAQCSAQQNGNSNGRCRILATVDVTTTLNPCP